MICFVFVSSRSRRLVICIEPITMAMFMIYAVEGWGRVRKSEEEYRLGGR